MELPTAFTSSLSPSSTISPEAGGEESRNWQELPRDVMVTILMKLDLRQILESTQCVCKSWYEACKDPVAWTKVQIIHDDPRPISEQYEKLASIAVDRSCGRMTEFSVSGACDDWVLLQISRANHLRCLSISSCYSLTPDAVAKSFQKLPLLEEIEFLDCCVGSSCIRLVGQSCPNLVSFKLNRSGFVGLSLTGEDDRDARAIAKNMPNIRHLQLIGSVMSSKGLQVILDGCSCLESLDLRACFLLDLSGSLVKRCAEKVNNVKWSYDSISDCGFPTWFDDEDGYAEFCYERAERERMSYIFDDSEDFDEDDDDDDDDDVEEEEDEDHDNDRYFDGLEPDIYLGYDDDNGYFDELEDSDSSMGNYYDEYGYFDDLTRDDYEYLAELEYDLFFGNYDNVFSDDSNDQSDVSLEEPELDADAMQRLFGDTDGSFGPNAGIPERNNDLGESNLDGSKVEDEIDAEARCTLEPAKEMGLRKGHVSTPNF